MHSVYRLIVVFSFQRLFGSREIRGNEFLSFLTGGAETFWGRKNRFYKINKLIYLAIVTALWVSSERGDNVGVCLRFWADDLGPLLSANVTDV